MRFTTKPKLESSFHWTQWICGHLLCTRCILQRSSHISSLSYTFRVHRQYEQPATFSKTSNRKAHRKSIKAKLIITARPTPFEWVPKVVSEALWRKTISIWTSILGRRPQREVFFPLVTFRSRRRMIFTECADTRFKMTFHFPDSSSPSELTVI